MIAVTILERGWIGTNELPVLWSFIVLVFLARGGRPLLGPPVASVASSDAIPELSRPSGTAGSYLALCSTSEVRTLRTCGAAVSRATNS